MVSTLGLSCPSGGAFYVCQNNATEFIGCCTSDPCADGSGQCPKNKLRPSSFSGDRYADIPPQQCATDNSTAKWYTCMATLPPFLGCCQGNPCATGACLANELEAAKLSSDPASRGAFLSMQETPSSQSDKLALPTGAIVGIAVGGALLVFSLLAIVVYKCGWHARKRKERESFVAPILPGAGTGPGMRESAGSSKPSYGCTPSPRTPSYAYPAPSPRSPSYGQFHTDAMRPGSVLSAPYGNYTDNPRWSAQPSPAYQSGENCPVEVSELGAAERPVSELPATDVDPGLAAASRPLWSSSGGKSKRISGQNNIGPPNGPAG